MHRDTSVAMRKYVAFVHRTLAGESQLSYLSPMAAATESSRNWFTTRMPIKSIDANEVESHFAFAMKECSTVRSDTGPVHLCKHRMSKNFCGRHILLWKPYSETRFCCFENVKTRQDCRTVPHGEWELTFAVPQMSIATKHFSHF